MTAPSPRFRQLALATLLLTFLLIVIGGIVRVSDSGLGCGPADSGLEGWPFCNGDVVPGVDLNSIIEYTHRVVASVVGLMMLALAVLAWRNYREHRTLVRVTIAGFVLVAAQGALGGVVVEENLEEELVAAHLGLAMLLLAVLFWIWRATKPETIGSDPPDGGPRYRPLAWVASVAVLCTIIAGGYMAGTQNYGRADYQIGDGAHHACGKEFPTCNGEFMPFGEARLVDIHLMHRLFMYIAVVARAGTRRADAAAPTGSRAGEGCVGRARHPLRPGARGRPERLARRIRGADRAPPRARDAAVVDCHRHDADALPRSIARPRRRARRQRGGRVMEAVRVATAAPTSFRTVVSDYFEMTKPKVQSLLLFTTVTTMLVAGDPSLGLVLLTCLGGALSAGGAGAVNHWFDRDLDALMSRTASRPVASGRVSPRAALLFGVGLGVASVVLLSMTVNPLAAASVRFGVPRLRLRLHGVAEALDAAEHRHRRRGRRGAAAGRLGRGDRRAVRDRAATSSRSCSSGRRRTSGRSRSS